MVDVTVAIPTYNGEQRLPKVLEALRSQIEIHAITWEVMVVDNNSQDQTAQVVQHYQSDFPCLLRYTLEPLQGAAYARKRAVQEANGTWIGFLDDDNIPDPDWVAAAYRFAQTHGQAGAFASRVRAHFESSPPPGFDRLLPFLAVTERGNKPLYYSPQKKLLPPAAGLVVRRQAWLESVPEKTILAGRINGDFLGGEDLEVLTYIQKQGWEIWYNPTMQITHELPAWRLERDYLISLFRGIGLSRYVTRAVGISTWRWVPMLLLYCLNDLRKVVWYFLRHGRSLPIDVVAACEMTLLTNSLLSPIYWWRIAFLKCLKNR
jgi:glycosyltransferase involved in cell wall biosynthesis